MPTGRCSDDVRLFMLVSHVPCWNMLEHVGTCWNVLEHVGTCWNMLEHVGTCWNIHSDSLDPHQLEPAGALTAVSESS